MNQNLARKIVQSLPSLYPIKDFEEEAILTILTAKPFHYETEGEDDREELIPYCPNCDEMIYNEEDRFCKKCGQPLTDE